MKSSSPESPLDREEPSTEIEKTNSLFRTREYLLEHPQDVKALMQAGILLQEMHRFDEAAMHLGRALLCLGKMNPCSVLDNSAHGGKEFCEP